MGSAALAWLLLVGWGALDYPGLHLDEAWSILAARGRLEPANPLSGMTRYAGPFPELLVRVLGAERGLLALRGASLVCNVGAVALTLRWLDVACGGRDWRFWGVPLLATLPIWVVSIRFGVEIQMFGPLLAALSFYLLTRKSRASSLAAGVSFGVSAYSHLLGALVPASAALGWLAVHRARPPRRWAWTLTGFAVGFAPRLLALALYPEGTFGWTDVARRLGGALGDLPSLPMALLQTLNGELVYQRVVGVEHWTVAAYWGFGALFLLACLGRVRDVPRVAWVTLSSSAIFCVLSTLAAPTLAVRYLLLPVIGVCAFLVQLGALGARRGGRWARGAVHAAALAIVAGNLFYLVVNFHGPWLERRLGFSAFSLGARAPRVTNWTFLPKEGLVEALLSLEPRPGQVVSRLSIARPLEALLEGSGIASRSFEGAAREPGTVLATFRTGVALPRRCARLSGERVCFREPLAAGPYFSVYSRMDPRRSEPDHAR